MDRGDNGWTTSASAWIADMGEHGDFARKYVLDQPMLQRVRAGAFQNALDIGCGEGRFCRALRAEGLTAVGVEPCSPLRETAIVRDPGRTCCDGKAEDLLIANRNSFKTAGSWKRYEDSSIAFSLDHYLTKRALWLSWQNISIRNWHCPFAFYMKLLIDAGLQLTYFDEPAPIGGDPESERYRRSPYFHIMEWRKKKQISRAPDGYMLRCQETLRVAPEYYRPRGPI